jgi:hypothetical protein
MSSEPAAAPLFLKLGIGAYFMKQERSVVIEGVSGPEATSLDMNMGFKLALGGQLGRKSRATTAYLQAGYDVVLGENVRDEADGACADYFLFCFGISRIIPST